MKQFTIYFGVIMLIISACNPRSGRKQRNLHADLEHSGNEQADPTRNRFKGKTVVKMEKKDGVYHIPVTINGANMTFIFDTGAGLISISNVEASYLYKQGKLTLEDIVGEANFIDANGDISVGTIIKLKEVTISNRTIYNVNASVVDNSQAPLLFGQSALEKFGRISIDYYNNTITFE